MLCRLVTSPAPGLSSSRSRQVAESRHRLVCARAVGKTVFSNETSRLTKIIVTRQALKTCLNYLSETNGELHYFLHNYISDNPLSLDPRVDPDEWLVKLASTPLTTVSDPRRSSIVCPASVAAATRGEREVSPRDVAERIMGLRAHIAQEMADELQQVAADNSNVLRRSLQRTYTELKLPEL